MKTITKRADELRRGDVLVTKHGLMAIVLRQPIAAKDMGRIDVWVMSGADELQGYTSFDANALVSIKASELTPAQEHAEELLQWVRKAAQRKSLHEDIPALNELLDKIDPPKPPTLGEALQLIGLVAEEKMPHYDTYKTRKEWAEDILNRARRSGFMPKGDGE